MLTRTPPSAGWREETGGLQRPKLLDWFYFPVLDIIHKCRRVTVADRQTDWLREQRHSVSFLWEAGQSSQPGWIQIWTKSWEQSFLFFFVLSPCPIQPHLRAIGWQRHGRIIDLSVVYKFYYYCFGTLAHRVLTTVFDSPLKGWPLSVGHRSLVRIQDCWPIETPLTLSKRTMKADNWKGSVTVSHIILHF